MTSRRVHAIAVTEDQDGYLLTTPELDDVFLTPDERVGVAIKKMSNGTVGGRSKVAQPVIPTAQAKEIIGDPTPGVPIITFTESFAAPDGSAPGPDLPWTPQTGTEHSFHVHSGALTPSTPFVSPGVPPAAQTTPSIYSGSQLPPNAKAYFMELTLANVNYTDLAYFQLSMALGKLSGGLVTGMCTLNIYFNTDPSPFFHQDPAVVQVFYHDDFSFQTIGLYVLPSCAAGDVFRVNREASGITILQNGSPIASETLMDDDTFHELGDDVTVAVSADLISILPSHPYVTGDLAIEALSYGSTG